MGKSRLGYLFYNTTFTNLDITVGSHARSNRFVRKVGELNNLILKLCIHCDKLICKRFYLLLERICFFLCSLSFNLLSILHKLTYLPRYTVHICLKGVRPCLYLPAVDIEGQYFFNNSRSIKVLYFKSFDYKVFLFANEINCQHNELN